MLNSSRRILKFGNIFKISLKLYFSFDHLIYSISFFIFPFAQSSLLNNRIIKTHHHTCVQCSHTETIRSCNIIFNYFVQYLHDRFSCLILISTQSNSRNKLCISINDVHQNVLKPLKAENRKQIKHSYIIMIDYID